ncbi:hypothetical protein H0H92_011641 [Tricholoma furcatifolium]|nr:hypothetical protein H0H92_011641 [Tricholoma furcatifolium]
MISNPVLPTLDRLKASLPASADATAIAREWLSILSDANAKQDNDLTETLFLPDSYWRDILALTSDIQSIEGWDNIKSLLVSRRSHLSSIRLLEEPHNAPTITSLFPDLVILLFTFAFDTLIGAGSGVGRLVPDGDGKWRAFTIFTCLDSLKGHVEKVGVNRIDTCTPFVDPWEASRKQQIELQDRDPDVLIIGAGQAGLEIAAHLKQLDVPTLVLERLPRIGDTWRNRYDSLALHDTVWFDHPPYMPFPATWPVYCSAGKLANFFEAYAETLELSVWTSAVIEKTEWDGTKKNWSVTIKRQERVRTMTVKHLVFATGFGGGIPNMPSIPNQDLFQGKVYHSSAFKSAREFAGKKAIVVGACNSAHDIAQDFTKHGVDVTMFQRSPTYYISAEAIAFLLGGLYKEGTDLEYADRVNASLTHTVTKLIHKRVTPHVAETIDKDIRDGLEKAGFKTYLGLDNDGIFPLLFTRGGGYYIGVKRVP